MRKCVLVSAGVALTLLLSPGVIARTQTPPAVPDSRQPVVRQKDRLFHGALVNARQVERADPYWQRANQEEFISVKALQAAHRKFKTPAAQVLARGDQKRKVVTLTFDDGPHPDFTPRLLKILADNHVKATFFVVGAMVEKHPELARQIVEQGHEIANHTFSHVNLSKLPFSLMRIEYRACSDIVERFTGKRPRYARPPGGQLNRDVLISATEEGMTTVLWNDDPGDYANPGVDILRKNIHKTLTNGAIILLHDGSVQMLELLPGLLEELHKKRWTISPLEEVSRLLR